MEWSLSSLGSLSCQVLKRRSPLPRAFWRVGRDHFNTQFEHRPANLGKVGQIHFVTGFWSEEEMTGSVGIDGTKESLGSDGVMESQHTFSGILLWNEFSVVDLVRGIIHDDDE